MNTIPPRPAPDDRERLARLVPGPADRVLPDDRRRRLQEFVMTRISEEATSGGEATTGDEAGPRGEAGPGGEARSGGGVPRRPSRRRRVLVVSALAVATATVAVVAVNGGSSGHRGGTGTAVPSGRRILLAAADTAERTPEGTGDYWHVKVVVNEPPDTRTEESWTGRDGRYWWRGSAGKVAKSPRPALLGLAGSPVGMAQIRGLPTEPAALKQRLAANSERGFVAGPNPPRPSAALRERLVVEGLVSLVSQLPATPGTRAAALRLLAGYPNVRNLGRVGGGQGLRITFDGTEKPALLVIDPATARVRRTNLAVNPSGAVARSKRLISITAEWTTAVPRR
ncbi:CU044_5270 family protein [Actinomadura fibrosa]|uniref:CU044_5270 family protein n=1 Tax=Actinomadura fibrosa TaxID=111802 RepID=A0ABW2XTQ7_9ACTN|nr:CU044_5270 family protein [Actinomadura fibrosa]